MCLLLPRRSGDKTRTGIETLMIRRDSGDEGVRGEGVSGGGGGRDRKGGENVEIIKEKRERMEEIKLKRERGEGKDGEN